MIKAKYSSKVDKAAVFILLLDHPLHWSTVLTKVGFMISKYQFF